MSWSPKHPWLHQHTYDYSGSLKALLSFTNIQFHHYYSHIPEEPYPLSRTTSPNHNYLLAIYLLPFTTFTKFSFPVSSQQIQSIWSWPYIFDSFLSSNYLNSKLLPLLHFTEQTLFNPVGKITGFFYSVVHVIREREKIESPSLYKITVKSNIVYFNLVLLTFQHLRIFIHSSLTEFLISWFPLSTTHLLTTKKKKKFIWYDMVTATPQLHFTLVY